MLQIRTRDPSFAELSTLSTSIGPGKVANSDPDIFEKTRICIRSFCRVGYGSGFKIYLCINNFKNRSLDIEIKNTDVLSHTRLVLSQ